MAKNVRQKVTSSAKRAGWGNLFFCRLECGHSVFAIGRWSRYTDKKEAPKTAYCKKCEADKQSD